MLRAYTFIVFGLIRSGLEPMIYRTRGEHANHYTTDAVCFVLCTCTPERNDMDVYKHERLFNYAHIYKLM